MVNNNNDKDPQKENEVNSRQENKVARQDSISAYETPKNDSDRYLIDRVKNAIHTNDWKPFIKLLNDTEKLTKYNLNINSTNTMGDNVFLLICKIDNIKTKERFHILKKLIELKADLTHVGEDHQNCLHIATNQKKPKLLKFILKFILKLPELDQLKLVEQKDSLGNLPLHYAAQWDHHKWVGPLSNYGYLNPATNKNHETAFGLSISESFKIALAFQNASIDKYNEQKFPSEENISVDNSKEQNLSLKEVTFIEEQIKAAAEAQRNLEELRKLEALRKFEVLRKLEAQKKLEEQQKLKEQKQFKSLYGREKSRSFNKNKDANDEDRGLRKSPSVLAQPSTASNCENSVQEERVMYNKTFVPANASLSPTPITPSSLIPPQTVGSLGTNPQLTQSQRLEK